MKILEISKKLYLEYSTKICDIGLMHVTTNQVSKYVREAFEGLFTVCSHHYCLQCFNFGGPFFSKVVAWPKLCFVQ